MDYKYIEQLISRYWDCATSPEEESILRAFFSQKEVPAELARYKSLFEYEQQQQSVGLGDDFDSRILARIGQNEAEAPQAEMKVVKTGRVTWTQRLRPLYRAAAAVSIITLLGTAAQHQFTTGGDNAAWDYNGQAYKDSYQDPQKAYEAGMKALEMFKEGPQTAVVDSAKQRTSEPRPSQGD